MTSQEANRISIKGYLAQYNIYPKKEKSYYGMYFSPLRTENVPSFKVDYRKNLWYDFGAGQGGTLIDLVIKLESCSFIEAMKKLENGQVYNIPVPVIQDNKQGKVLLRYVSPLNNQFLIKYLSERRIDMDTAKYQCREVHYSIDGKNYYAIGFGNDSGGYELRSRYFKGTVSPKDITTVENYSSSCYLFEGFMDYLSYLTYYKQLLPVTNIVVLNSTAQISKALDYLQKQDVVKACLDNDPAGRKALAEIISVHGNVVDLSECYGNHKDLNDFLCGTGSLKYHLPSS